MDLFSLFWPQSTDWQDLAYQLSSILSGLFLLLLAGLTYTRLSRQPREAKWLLAAIGVNLVGLWVLPRVLMIVMMMVYRLVGVTYSNWLGIGFNVFSQFLSIVVMGLCWWCLLRAGFDAPATPLDEEPAGETVP